MVYYSLLEDSIEINPSTLRKYNLNIHTLHSLCISLNSALEGSKHYVEQVESFMASSFTLANDLYKIGLQIPQIGELSTSISQLNKEINQLLPQSLRDCKIILDYSVENSVHLDHTETFKTLKQEVDKYLVESIQYRRELKTLLLKYSSKSTSDSQSDKIAGVMAKLTQSLSYYEKYLSLLETELDEFCGARKKYLLNLSQNILNLHHLVHFGRKLQQQQSNDNEESYKLVSPSSSLQLPNVTLSSPSIPTSSLTQSTSISTLSEASLIRKTFSADSISSYNSNKKVITTPPPTHFDDIIENTVYLKAFRIFSEKHHGIENLLFYLDCHSLKQLEARKGPRDTARTMFLNMYNNYIIPGASYEINIDSEARISIDDRKTNLMTDEDFYPCLSVAIEAISALLNYSMFPLFLKSPLYQAASILERGANQSDPSPAGVSKLTKSLDTLISHPIGLEYFLLYLKPSRPTSPNTSSSSNSPSTTSPFFRDRSNSMMIGGSPSHSAPSSASTSPNTTSPLSSSLITSQPRFSPLLLQSPAVSVNDARNMIFLWLNISRLKELSEEFVDSYAYELYDTYIRVSAEKEISILSYVDSVRQSIQEAIASKQCQRVVMAFDSIGQDIILQLTNTHFQIFLQSNVCKDMLGREEKMIKYMEKEKKKPENKVELQFEQISKEKLKAIFPRTRERQASVKPGTLPPIAISSTLNTSGVIGGDKSQSGQLSPTANSSSSGGTAKSLSPSPSFYSTSPSPSSSLTPIVTSPSLTSSNNSGSSLSHSNSYPNHSIFDQQYNSSNINNNNNTNNGSKSPNISQQRKSNIDVTNSLPGGGVGQNTAGDKPNEVFCYILSETTWLDTFKRFVKSEKCEELLLCWMELERYCRSGKSSLAAANNIYENFFLEGSPLEVNLEPELKHAVRDALKSEVLSRIDLQLKLSCQSSFELLRVDCFGRFIRSSVFKELSLQVGDPFDPKNRKKISKK